MDDTLVDRYAQYVSDLGWAREFYFTWHDLNPPSPDSKIGTDWSDEFPGA